MSRTALILFADGKASDRIEYSNSWGGAARIWNALFDKYLKRPDVPCDCWITDNGERLWKLIDDPRLNPCERAALFFTFDHCLVAREDFAWLAAQLREFDATNPAPGNYVNHLPAWADALEQCAAEAVGLYSTSCGENLWCLWDEDAEESRPYDISTGTAHWWLTPARVAAVGGDHADAR